MCYSIYGWKKNKETQEGQDAYNFLRSFPLNDHSE